MNNETLIALRESITHWEENVAAEDPSQATVTSASCALCELYSPRSRDNPVTLCDGCPVCERTGLSGCRGTPYTDAYDAKHRWAWNGARADARLEWRRIAQKELDFLKSLLPQGAQDFSVDPEKGIPL